MSKQIFIICNSAQAFKEIAAGNWPQLPNADLFTCNNAYTFFRTEGRHLNFFTDTLDIVRKVTMPETLSLDYQKKVVHIFSPFGLTLANGNLIYRDLIISPVSLGASTALGALAYLAAAEKYEEIILLGYTLDETFNKIWADILERYNEETMRPCVYKFTLKK